MKKYLSIGEVSKIKEVSHTSLRYYDEIGVLIPAYTNPDNGYRYYAKGQMIILDFIILAVELGMPLKELEKYIKDDAIDIENFTYKAKEIINSSINKLQRNLYFFESTAKHIKENEKNLEKNKEYIREFNTRYFLTLPSNHSLNVEEFDLSAYWKQMTELYLIIKEHEIFADVDQGLYFYKENNTLKSMAYVDIKKCNKKKIGKASVIQVPKGEFLCAYYPDFNLDSTYTKFAEHEFFEKNNILIISDVLEKMLKKNTSPFELQVFMG